MDSQALSGHYSGPFFDLVDETIDAEPGKPCVTFQFTDCTCPPYCFNADGTVVALPQGTDPGCPLCHPIARVQSLTEQTSSSTEEILPS